MRLLITGGAGYIGAQTAWLAVEAGHEVVVLDDLSTGFRGAVPPAAAFVRGDVADSALVRRIAAEHRVQALLHFAASVVAPESVARPLDYYANNTAGVIGLLKGCLDAGVREWVLSSTAAVYGDAAEVVDEQAPTQPQSPYGRSKLMAEAIARDAAGASGARAVLLRYFNVAGADPDGRAGQSTLGATHLVKVACEAALGRRAALTIHGDDWPTPDGTGVRDYVHVHDLARAHLLAVDHLATARDGETTLFNLGSGAGHSVREIVRAVEAAAGHALPIVAGPRRPGDVARIVADAGLARRSLGWFPRYGLADIAAHALAWEARLETRAKTSGAT